VTALWLSQVRMISAVTPVNWIMPDGSCAAISTLA